MDITEFKQLLIDTADELRNASKMRNLNNIGKAFVNGQINVIELLLIHIARGETDMEKLQKNLINQVVRLEDIQMRTRTTELDKMLLATVEELEPGTAGVVSADVVGYAHLQTKVSKMKKRKQIPENIFVSRAGDKVYIVKK